MHELEQKLTPEEILSNSSEKLAEIASKLSEIFKAGFDAGFIGKKTTALLEAYKQDTIDYIDRQIDYILTGSDSDGILETIAEISAALNNDANAFATLVNKISAAKSEANAYTDERAVSKFGDTMTGPLKFKSSLQRCGGYINPVYSDNPAGCGINFGSSDNVDSSDITTTERCGIKFMHSQTNSDGTRLPLADRAVLFATDDRLYRVEYDASTNKYTETGTELGFDTRYDYKLISEENNPVTDKGNQVYVAKYYNGKNYISTYYCVHKAKKIRQFGIWGKHNVAFDSLTDSKEAKEDVITDENILRRYKSSAMKRDSNGRCSVMGPTLPKHVANKEYVDKQDSITLKSANEYTDKKISNCVSPKKRYLHTCILGLESPDQYYGVVRFSYIDEKASSSYAPNGDQTGAGIPDIPNTSGILAQGELKKYGGEFEAFVTVIKWDSGTPTIVYRQFDAANCVFTLNSLTFRAAYWLGGSTTEI